MSETLLASVQRKFESITDSENHGIEAVGDESSFIQKLELRTSQKFHVSPDIRKFTGPLPSEVIRLNNEQALFNAIAAETDRLLGEGSENLLRWAQEDKGSYRRLVGNARLFNSLPCTLGFEYICSQCEGQCQIQCGACNGHGRLTCGKCSGSGAHICGQCEGSKLVNCPTCNNNPVRYRQEPYSEWNQNTQQYVSRIRDIKELCYNCGVSGKVQCLACDAHGQETCSRCDDDGKVSCQTCGRRGKVNCKQCDAKGCLHATGTVAMEVQVSDELFGVVEDKGLERLLANDIDTADFIEYGALSEPVQHTIVDRATLQSSHALDMPVHLVDLTYRGEHYPIIALGKQRKVVDYGGLLRKAHLSSLTHLRNVIGSGFSLAPGRTKQLQQAYEVLDRIPELAVVRANPMASREEIQNIVDTSKGVLDMNTALECAELVKRYANAIFKSIAWKWSIVPIVLAGVLFSLITGSHEYAPCYAKPKLLTLVAALLPLLVAEVMARKQTEGILEQGMFTADRQQLIRQSAFRWRLVTLVGMGAAVGVAFFIKYQLLTSFPYTFWTC